MTRYALLTGIEEYEDAQIENLKYALKDVLAFQKMLVEFLGYEEKNIYLFSHEKDGRYAVNYDIMERFSRLCAKMKPADTFVFYFAGHGIETEDGGYLMAANTRSYTPELLKGTSISIQFLKNEMARTLACQRIFILDACRNNPESARGGEDNLLTDVFSREIVMATKAKPEDLAPPSTGILFACSQGERAYEWPSKGHGIFSYYLIEGAQKIGREKGTVDLLALSDYVREKVSEGCPVHIAREKKQTPWLIFEGAAKPELGRFIHFKAPPGAGTGASESAPPEPESGETEWIESITGMEFTRIPGGRFQMGEIARDGESDERPVHPVELEPFDIAVYPVTFRQYELFCDEIMIPVPPDNGRQGGERPVINVSWNDAVAFAGWLSEKTGHSFRLPTEAEWERAARGDALDRWPGTDDPSRLNGYAWISENSGGKPHTAGTKHPNSFGCFDMAGNVSEWVQDWYAKDYYGHAPEKDPTGPAKGTRLGRSRNQGCVQHTFHTLKCNFPLFF